TVSDGLLTSSALVSVDVRFGNIPPVANDDFYSVNEDSTLAAAAATGILQNDTDADHDTLSASLLTLPAHGVLALAASGSFTYTSDGSFDYTPVADFLGLDQFTYAAVDHFGAVGNTATVSITVALKTVSQAVNGGGTVSTGTDVTAADPLASAVTSPTAATI